MNTLYAGIDLHSNNNVLVIIDGSSTVIFEKRLKNDLSAVLAALAPYGREVAGVVVESTFNWYWLVDGLRAADYNVHLANTGAIQQYSGLKYGDDASDARWLAQMLSLSILPEAYIYPADLRPVRDLLSKRTFLVRQRTANILSIQNLVTRNTGRTVSADDVERLTSETSTELGLPDDVVLALNASLVLTKCAAEQTKALEKVARARVRLTENFQNLTTVDGIGTILGLTIMLETGSIERFASVGHYASYARCVGGARVSNGKKKAKVNTKNGNAYLSWAFSEAATHCIRYNTSAARFVQRKMGKCHLMVARRALAHKLARACYYILRDSVPFDSDKTFGGK